MKINIFVAFCRFHKIHELYEMKIRIISRSFSLLQDQNSLIVHSKLDANVLRGGAEFNWRSLVHLAAISFVISTLM